MAEVLLEKGAGVYILTPNKAFVSVVSYDNNIISSFELYTSINRRDAEDLSEEEKLITVEIVDNMGEMLWQETELGPVLILVVFVILLCVALIWLL